MNVTEYLVGKGYVIEHSMVTPKGRGKYQYSCVIDKKPIEDDISGYIVPTDPITKQPYEYNVKGAETFELCATFDLTSQPEQAIKRPGGEQSWQHDTGRTCFERTIDKELYPPDSEVKIPRPID